MWTVSHEPADAPDVTALLRGCFAELTVRYFHRAIDEAEIDRTLAEFPAVGLGAFLVLGSGGGAAGHLGVYPTGELTRFYVAPEHRRGGGGRALLAAAETWARAQRLPRIFLVTRHDLVEARSFYASCGFNEIPPAAHHPDPVPGPLVREAAALGVSAAFRGSLHLRGQTPQHCFWLCAAV